MRRCASIVHGLWSAWLYCRSCNAFFHNSPSLQLQELLFCMWELGSSGKSLSLGKINRISNKTWRQKLRFLAAITVLESMCLCVQPRKLPCWYRLSPYKAGAGQRYPSLCIGLFSDYFAIASHCLRNCVIPWCTKRVEYKEVITAISTARNIRNVSNCIHNDYSQPPKE